LLLLLLLAMIIVVAMLASRDRAKTVRTTARRDGQSTWKLLHKNKNRSIINVETKDGGKSEPQPHFHGLSKRVLKSQTDRTYRPKNAITNSMPPSQVYVFNHTAVSFIPCCDRRSGCHRISFTLTLAPIFGWSCIGMLSMPMLDGLCSSGWSTGYSEAGCAPVTTVIGSGEVTAMAVFCVSISMVADERVGDGECYQEVRIVERLWAGTDGIRSVLICFYVM